MTEKLHRVQVNYHSNDLQTPPNNRSRFHRANHSSGNVDIRSPTLFEQAEAFTRLQKQRDQTPSSIFQIDGSAISPYKESNDVIGSISAASRLPTKSFLSSTPENNDNWCIDASVNIAMTNQHTPLQNRQINVVLAHNDITPPAFCNTIVVPKPDSDSPTTDDKLTTIRPISAKKEQQSMVYDDNDVIDVTPPFSDDQYLYALHENEGMVDLFDEVLLDWTNGSEAMSLERCRSNQLIGDCGYFASDFS